MVLVVVVCCSQLQIFYGICNLHNGNKKIVLSFSGVVAWWPGGGGGRGQWSPSDKFLGALKSIRGAKIRNSNVKYYTKYVKSSLTTISKIVM